MIRALYSWILSLYEKKTDASGLALFRIAYSLILLCEVIQLFYFRHLIFDKIPFLEPSEVDLTIPLLCWMVSLICLMLGFYTRTAAVINYLFSLVFISTIETYEYHMFYVYMGVNFLLIFLNTAQVNSLDRLLAKLRYSNTRFIYVPPRTVSVLNYYSVVLIAIGFVYIDSVFFKLASYNWTRGLGMWLPAALPYMTHVDGSIILNNKWISLGLGYLTFVFEATFIFLFWRKKWRLLLFIIGLGLHVGIFILFPIPWFGLGVTALYLLMVPVGCWKRISSVFKYRQPVLQFYYDEECPLCNRTKIILSHLDSFNAIEFKGVQTHGFHHPALAAFSKDDLLDNIFSITKKGKVLQGIDSYIYAFKRMPSLFFIGYLISIPGIYHIAKWIYGKVALNRYVERCREDNCGYTPPAFPQPSDSIKLLRHFTVRDLKVASIALLMLFFFLLQLNVTYNSKLIREWKEKAGIAKSAPERMLNAVGTPVRYLSRTFFGITSHPVFMDSHFNGYNHIIGVEAVNAQGVKRWLPIIDKDGHAGWYLYGPVFVKWTFRVNSQHIKPAELEKGLRDFTIFWAEKNGLDARKFRFNVYVKKIVIPRQWEDDFLEKQKSQPWIKAGEASWDEHHRFTLQIMDVETL